MQSYRFFMFALPLLSACGDKDDDSAEHTPAEPAWYSTCGDPACSGYRGPTDGVAVCTDQTEGTACDTEGAQCDLETDCNTFMLCTTEDPKASEYGCPISRAKHKHRIHYLTAAEQQEARTTLLNTRLARWHYRWDAPDRAPHLGFLIDDQPDSPAVQADGEHVDLYGYTSLTVAAVQAQDAELQALRTELAETRESLSTLRAELAALRAKVESGSGAP